jgi:sporulation protein YlmC with PRC-barrel domain
MLKHLPGTAAALVAVGLLTGAAWAAQDAPAAGSAPAAAARASQVDTQKLIGRDVHNPAGDTIGEIETVVLDKSGQVKYVVVGVGGFLGVGEREVALPWRDLQVSDNGARVVVNMSKDQLAGMPAYSYPESGRRGTIFSE